jgi:hypothetical protein
MPVCRFAIVLDPGGSDVSLMSSGLIFKVVNVMLGLSRDERKQELVTRERVRKHIKWFETFAERGRVVELSGNHDLIVSNPREVLQQIEAFVSSLP